MVVHCIYVECVHMSSTIVLTAQYVSTLSCPFVYTRIAIHLHFHDVIHNNELICSSNENPIR